MSEQLYPLPSFRIFFFQKSGQVLALIAQNPISINHGLTFDKTCGGNRGLALTGFSKMG